MDSTQRPVLKIVTRIATAAAVLIVAVLVYYGLKATAPQATRAAPGSDLPRVAVLEAARMPVPRQWHGYGTAEAINSADVPARVTATVVELPGGILEGASVTKGQLLVKLDDSDFVRQVEIAGENLAELGNQLTLLEIEQKRLPERLEFDTENMKLARLDLDKIEGLVDDGSINTRERDRAKREWNAARLAQSVTAELLDKLAPRRRQLEARQAALQSSLQLAQQNLERCKIVSPLDGILQAVDVELGENVAPGQRVARVVDLRQVELPLRLPTSARVDVAVGDKVSLTSTNQTGLTWPSRVSRISPEDDAATRTVTVFVEVDQSREAARLAERNDAKPPRLLSPGMFVAGVVTSGRSEPRWVLPRRSVRSGRVFVVTDGTINSQPVRIDFLFEGKLPGFGLADDQWAVLDTDSDEQGFAEGDLVLVNASASVLEGDRVEPVLRAAARTASTQVSPGTAVEVAP